MILLLLGAFYPFGIAVIHDIGLGELLVEILPVIPNVWYQLNLFEKGKDGRIHSLEKWRLPAWATLRGARISKRESCPWTGRSNSLIGTLRLCGLQRNRTHDDHLHFLIVHTMFIAKRFEVLSSCQPLDELTSVEYELFHALC